MKTIFSSWRAARLTGLSATFVLTGLLAILVMGLLLLYLNETQLGSAGNAATAIAPFLAVVGIWVAAAALRTAERSVNPHIAAARQWLVNRRKLESQIDYLLYASPFIFSQIRSFGPGDDGKEATPQASMVEAAQSLLSIVGVLRRLRDALLTYTENHGLLIAMEILRNEGAENEGDPFNEYMGSFSSKDPTEVTTYLQHAEGWLFAGSKNGQVLLAPKATIQSVTELLLELDYLDSRASSMSTLLERSTAADGEDLCAASAEGGEKIAALRETVKNIYAHLVVFRACLEKEWALMFPKGTRNKRMLENRIEELLSRADDERFVFAEGKKSDNFAGFRFGHGLLHLNRVFSWYPSAQEVDADPIKSDEHLKSQVESLYRTRSSKE